MSDFDVDVGFFPGLGGELGPDHVTLCGVGVVADPTFPFVVGGCHCDVVGFVFLYEESVEAVL